jgi:hypothetical protein
MEVRGFTLHFTRTKEPFGGPQSQSGRGGEEKNSQLLPGLEPPIIQPVAQRCTAELSCLLVLFHEILQLRINFFHVHNFV